MILLLEFLFETLGNRLVFLFFLTNGIKFQKPICNSLLICRLRDMERRDERSGHHSHSYMYLMKTSSLKYTSVVNVDEEMRKFPGTMLLGLYPHAGRVGGHSFMSSLVPLILFETDKHSCILVHYFYFFKWCL